MRTRPAIAFAVIVAAGCAGSCTVPYRDAAGSAVETTNRVVSVSDVEWQKLNPARGDKSPQAGTLWGDRTSEVPTGFLAKFVDGFSSPPHVHNATYRAVVISGQVHNDDPDAAPMWMPAGSFWTQPKGEIHITAARGPTNIALVEIDRGPYLVLPPEQSFDSGERPINVHESNVIWVNPPGMPPTVSGPKVAYLWGVPAEGKSSGTFLRLPPHFSGKLDSKGATFHAVLIKGRLQYFAATESSLAPGSYFTSMGESVHQFSSASEEEAIIYIRTDGEYSLTTGF